MPNLSPPLFRNNCRAMSRENLWSMNRAQSHLIFIITTCAEPALPLAPEGGRREVSNTKAFTEETPCPILSPTNSTCRSVAAPRM